MLNRNHTAVPAQQAYAAFQQSRVIHSAALVPFYGAEGFDVYNPSMPFLSDGAVYMAGRVEPRDSHDSRVLFFKQQADGFYYDAAQRTFPLEDPFIATIHGELVFGGVRVSWQGDTPSFFTEFYRGGSIATLTQFARGPANMKDIRLCELPDGRIGVFTRPRSIKKLFVWKSLAKIGFTVINSLAELTAQGIQEAPLLNGQFTGVEWGGANEAFPLQNGLIGVVGHRSWGSYTSIHDSDLHYYGIAFALNLHTLETTPTQLILSRDCFPDGPCKTEGTRDVVFTSGMQRNGDGTATVYTGLSDAAVGKAVIPDPFLQWEQLVVCGN